MPPLRELRDDLPELIRILLCRIPQSEDLTLTPAALKALWQYNYPGNFRELENILERAVALSKNNLIDVDDLQIQSYQFEIASSLNQNVSTLENKLTETTETLHNFRLGYTQIQDYLDEVERCILEQALARTRFNRTQAAKLLGISFRSMRYRMERLGIS